MTYIRRLSLAAAALFLLLLPCLPASSQTTGDVIRRVVVEGNQRIEPSTVESYLALRPGDVYDTQKVDDSIKSLYATGLFDDVVDPAPGRRACWSRSSRTRSSTGSRSRVTSASRPRFWRARSSCGHAWSTPGPGSKTPSAASWSCTAATAAMPPRSSPRSSSSTRTGSIWCSRSTRARSPASAASASSATSSSATAPCVA